jgi:putative aldouronate transport system substrate-binding protein
MGKYIPALKEKNPKVNLAVVQYPVLNKGDVPKFIQRDWEYNTFGAAAISVANKNPVETVKWLDYLYSEEGHLLKNFGVDGLTYKMENGYPKYTDLITKNPDKLSIGEAMGKYFRANYPSPGLADDRYLEQYYEFPQQKEALKTLSKYADNAVKVLMPPATNSPQEAEELSKIMAEVKTYQSEMMFKFIMGVEPLDNFDKYKEQLKKMNIEKAISYKQAALDRYNKR